MITLTMLASIALGTQGSDPAVGSKTPAGLRVATGQMLRPAGTTIQFGARPVDLVTKDGSAYVKESSGITRIHLATNKVTGRVALPGGTSLSGLAFTEGGQKIVATGAGSSVFVIGTASLRVEKTIAMPKPKIGGEAYPCGLAIRGNTAYVALSRSNALGIVNLETGKTEQVAIDIAPFEVVLDGDRAFVSCWSRQPRRGEATQSSAGTEVPITGRSKAITGTVAMVDLIKRRHSRSIAVGLQPSGMLLTGSKLYVANANSDSVSLIDTVASTLVKTITVKPDWRLPFGSAPNAITRGPYGELYVACGGNNAVAVLDPTGKNLGWIPTGWYPSALAFDKSKLVVANAKGIGERNKPADAKGRNVYQFTGTLQVVHDPLPGLRETTKTVMSLANAPQILRAYQRSLSPAKPVPVPAKLGQPSVFEHVVYILKENRTYDEVFGDMGKGASDPSLVLFGRDVTPNQHALADKYVLLDNMYCNGVLSADGHAWAMEANATSYFERSFGGWTRSYPYGDDPLAVSQSGYIWDAVLAKGLSFRNYGEFDTAESVPKSTWKQVYDDWLLPEADRKIKFKHTMGVQRLKAYSHPTYPGWDMDIPDVLRAEIFLKEFAEFEAKGTFPNFTIIYLPQDHTSGMSEGAPSPQACVADNDLAVGRIVEALSKSQFWPKTCVFVIEDDPQAGLDHVDGHRTISLVVSPYTKRGKVVSNFYNQTSIIHTMLRILGVAPLNQMDAQSSLMTNCFTDKPVFDTYTAITPKIPLDQLNPKKAKVASALQKWVAASAKLDLSKPDLANEDLLNRIVWHGVKGNVPYPAKWAGAHGRGLKARGLKILDTEDDD